MPPPLVLLVIGSESDFPTMKATAGLLQDFAVPFRMHVASAHRTPGRVKALVSEAEDIGVQVIIAAAGMAAHLAGVIAGQSILPIIGVPMDSPHLSGVDSLYSTVMMPPGIPVASVGIGKAGAKNAAFLALSILALQDESIREKLVAYRLSLNAKVADMDASVQRKLAEEK